MSDDNKKLREDLAKAQAKIRVLEAENEQRRQEKAAKVNEKIKKYENLKQKYKNL